MSIDPEVNDIQTEWLQRNSETTRWIIVREPIGFSVHQHSIDGVMPSTEYLTKEAAAARLLQLMDISEPVTPQNWPERVGISGVSTPEGSDRA